MFFLSCKLFHSILLSEFQNNLQHATKLVFFPPCIATMHTSKGQDVSQNELKEKPNYFVAVQITDSEVHSALKEVQEHILRQEGRLEKCMNPLSTLHVTLMVMRINDTETHLKALTALQSVYKQINEVMCKDPLNLEFHGLGHFRNTVLYAKLSNNDAFNRLSDLAQSVRTCFSHESIYSTDRREFNPHLTIAKLRYEDTKKLKLRRINPDFYNLYQSKYFGKQTVQGIQLLSMDDEKNEDGYYVGTELLFGLKESSLNDLVATEEKKIEVRKKISELVENVLKKTF